MAGGEAVDDEACADQGQGSEGDADARPVEVLRKKGTDLCANGRAGLHDKSDENVDVSVHGMTERAVARGDNDFKKVRPDGDVGWNAEKVNEKVISEFLE